ncbi:glycosyl hydrolase 115 family protein [Olivibacter domesticus]|uniref:Glycosyl hydrolase family 115 n=1 Tax=Olivibacter domesticus TaxID=407022 RepID=A0A1H7ZAV7_OLID1|nr:glycosyl hydrolase 115 family protein [Olivibacter domesticus]SEM54647.1 Glycosyl hydrolase family 115 [Olivibacter domesticus]
MIDFKKSCYFFLFALLISPWVTAQENTFPIVTKTIKVSILYDKQAPKLDSITANLLAEDIERVTSFKPKVFTDLSKANGNVIVIGSVTSPLIKKFLSKEPAFSERLNGKWESFGLNIVDKPIGTISKALVIAGSDPRGTAFGVFTLSEKIGVSPWYWWADVPVKKSEELTVRQESYISASPTVKYRGIFINDEDWGLQPWAAKTFEPETGDIGPKTYAKVFELLLRLKANLIWPAMHPSTKAFFHYPGNPKVAEDYQIVIGSSHAEPMLRNNVDEWDVKTMGHFNYLTNKERIYKYWEDRVKESEGINAIYTIGMRGIHDGQMEGVKDMKEAVPLLDDIIKEERGLLAKYINKDVTAIPQVLTPYKEVLEIYNNGLKVPEDVTLVWPDDNYGYIRHFPSTTELKRRGGNGVYYHVSYWGRPHDHLWLGTTHPALVYQQMKLAYDSGIQKMWILNVGDIKPSEYQIELFLDMAWNINQVSAEGIAAHLNHWLERIFDTGYATQITPLMEEHHRLAYIRKPEFMGHTRVEERDSSYQVISDLPWSEKEIKDRLLAYDALSTKAEKITNQLPTSMQDAFFELVKYPVQAAAQMNRKLLLAQLARHDKADWQQSDMAFDSIVTLTGQYNDLKAGKWNHIMDYQPRKLPVFGRVNRQQATKPLPPYHRPRYSFNGTDFDSSTGKSLAIEGLGYEGKALSLQKNSNISFKLPNLNVDSIWVEVRLLPNHPVEGQQLRFGIALNNGNIKEITYQTQDRNEEWKENVLRNQAIRRIVLPVTEKRNHVLTLTALDAGVVIDQVFIYD